MFVISAQSPSEKNNISIEKGYVSVRNIPFVDYEIFCYFIFGCRYLK